MSAPFDIIIVGSGCSGVQAAQTLVESGLKVLMLDVGLTAEHNLEKKVPDSDFVTIRKTDENQSSYFLGDDLGEIDKTWEGTKNRLTPALKFVEKDVDKWLPKIQDASLNFMESLAKGGLGNAWGRGSFSFDIEELEKAGFHDASKIQKSYECIISRIGISGNPNTKSLSDLKGVFPAMGIDKNMAKLWRTFYKKEKSWNEKNIFLERTPIAVFQEEEDRRRYNDMDFWSLSQTTGYHPGITLEQLARYSNFHYIPHKLVTSFKEENGIVLLKTTDTKTRNRCQYKTRKLILCASVLGTARIILNSFAEYDRQLPLICNPFYYTCWLNLKMLGKSNSLKKSSFSQLSLYFQPNQESGSNLMNMYSYRSMLFQKLMKNIPFSLRMNYQLIAILKEAFVIGGVHLPEGYIEGNGVQLSKSLDGATIGKLKINYDIDQQRIKESYSYLKRKMLSLRCAPLSSMPTLPGGSKHYGGTLPFSLEEKPFTLSTTGRLHQTQNVYVGDASGFKFLPAKGLTLTIMANAHQVALNILKKSKVIFQH